MLQVFEANKDTMSEIEYARLQVELAITLAAIQAIEASIAAESGQGYDLNALVNSCQIALNLLNSNQDHLTVFQSALAHTVLNTVAEVMNSLGGNII